MKTSAKLIQGRIRCVNHAWTPPHRLPGGGVNASQYPAIGVQCSLKPITYERTSANHTGGAEMLSSAKTSTPRSKGDRGRRAVRTPSTVETSTQRIAPPTT